MVVGNWSMRHIIHKFVNVYPYIAYSCEVAIHIIISWILGSGPRWYGKCHSHVIQEQGNNYSWVDLIAFLFEVFKYLFKKKLFFRQIFLKSIYFSSCKIPENQKSASLMVTNKVMSYTDCTMTPCLQKVSIATYICIWSTMYNHYANSHICCLWHEKDPIWFLGTKVKLVAWTLYRFYVLKLTHPLLYDDDTITHAANNIKRIFLIVE